MTKALAGKVALVTGGTRGIGAATVRALAENGADVAFSYATSVRKAAALVRELEGMGVRSVAIKADQAEPSQVEALVEEVVGRFGRLDILVNNAGIFVVGTVEDPSGAPGAVERQFAIHVGGVATAVRAAARVLGDGGRIIAIGSVLASRVGFPGVADYAAAKAAVAAYTRGWARDLGPRGITVNTVQAGAIDTDMNPATSAHAPAWNATVALGRYGRPEEVAAGIVFLASPAASYITGTVLTIDGGYGA
jgi:3-oxoacyl-[acyl-carrier protein] reductase